MEFEFKPNGGMMKKLLDLRNQIVENLRKTPAIESALQGKLTKQTLAEYLTNAHYYAGFSPKIMAMAAVRCMDQHPHLAKYLLRHAEEEQGHDRWAFADLRDLGISGEEIRRSNAVNSCYALVGYVHFVAAFGNPVGIFGWMYILESVGDDLGGILTEVLKKQFGQAALRFVGGHAEADVGHTREITEQIEKYIHSETDQDDILLVASVVADLYVRMLQEIGERSSL